MPNTLVVSPFDCPFSEFEAMVKKVDNVWKIHWMQRSTGSSDLSLWD